MLIFTRFFSRNNLYFLQYRNISLTLNCWAPLLRNVRTTRQQEHFPKNQSFFLIARQPSDIGTVAVIVNKRFKYTKRSTSKNEEESDSDDESEEFKDERDSKVIKTTVNSLRADLILKAGLSMARNKIEVAFYENKIRVNGQKPTKKSQHLNIGDEIDVVRGFSTTNPALLSVSRIMILSAKEKDESIAVQLRRYKNLLIENYEGSNIYRSSE